MLQLINTLPLLSLLHFGNAAPAPSLFGRQNTGCSAYTIINTRGTTEPQAESSGFITMNKAIRSAIPGIETYNTVYPADSSQTSSVGTDDIIAHITSVLSSDPGQCFVLEGYSQGAKSTVQAMPSLTGKMFDAVKAVFLIGNPYHKAGLACNVDIEGGGSTLDVDGKSLNADNAIPDNWVEKTMDVCNKGDGVCDTTNGQKEITDEHTAYQGNTKMQNLGADFVIKAFNAGSAPAASSGGADESTSAAIDVNSTTESVPPISSNGPVAYTAPYPSSVASSSSSTSSSNSIESLPTPSSDLSPAPTSDASLVPSSESLPAPSPESPPGPISEAQPIPTSVLAVAESSPAAPSAPNPDLPSPSSTVADIPESPSSQPASPPRTRCQ